ncbi:MAG: response regulator transcription factor [Bryobacteraceae bacterium]
MIRVLIADDHPIVRRGLIQIVASQPDLQVTAECGDGNEALRLVETRSLDVAVLDIGMPGISGLELLSRLRSQHPRLPVLILSAYPESELAVRVLKAGAAGYLNKEMAPEELVAAIRRVAAGRRYVSPETAEMLADSVAGGDEQPHAALSDREYQVLLEIASGRTVGEIAADMNLSVKTVSTYRTRVLEKMNMRNNAELMHYVIQKGLTGKWM